MAKKTIRRVKYPLEDNVKRVVFLRDTQGPAGAPVTPQDFEIPYATRLETDAGVLLDKSLNPDVGAYAYDRLRKVGRHEAGKGTKTVVLSIVGGVATVDSYRSNVFRLLVTGDFTFSIINPVPGQVYKVRFKQDGTGGHTVTWPADVRWPLGSEPTLTTDPGAVDVAYFAYDEEDLVWEGSFLPDYTGTGSSVGQFNQGPEGPAGPQGAEGPVGETGAPGDFLVNLGDVDAYLAADGDTLIYDAGLGLWVASPPGAGTGDSQTYVQAANLVITSNNTFQDTDLVASLTAGTYSIQVDMGALSHVTPDMEVRPNYTGTVTSAAQIRSISNSAGSGNAIANAALTTQSMTATETYTVRFSIRLVVSDSGTFSMQARQVTSSGTSVTFYAGSTMRVTQLA